MIFLIDKILALIVAVLAVYVVYIYNISFDHYVNVEYVKYHDMCVGDKYQMVTAKRNVKKDIDASVKGELFIFEDLRKIETTIRRSANFVYQKSDIPIIYQIEWEKPITKEGAYGASDLVLIQPLPFLEKSKYFSEDEQRFNVVNCNN